MNSLKELFEEEIKDLHNAEKQITKALPKMIKAASNQQLKEGMQRHLIQTEEHVRRLEAVAKQVGFRPTGKVCKAMQGLVEEANEVLKEGKPSPVLDAAMIAAAQRVEHYEIAGYGSAIQYAKLLGHQEAVDLMLQTIKEEEATDQSLTQIAETQVNPEAARMPEPEPASRRRSTAGTRSRSESHSKTGGRKAGGSTTSRGGSTRSKSGSRSR
jgi:ferritin-like metal-binding protein YciE